MKNFPVVCRNQYAKRVYSRKKTQVIYNKKAELKIRRLYFRLSINARINRFLLWCYFWLKRAYNEYDITKAMDPTVYFSFLRSDGDFVDTNLK